MIVKKVWLIGTGLITILVPLVWLGLEYYYKFESQRLFIKIENECVKKYCYETLRGTINQSFYSKKKEGGFDLVDYYNKVAAIGAFGKEKRKKIFFPPTGDSVFTESVTIPPSISLTSLSVKSPVYVIDTSASPVIKIIKFNTNCWAYFEAFVPKQNLHDSLPSDSLLKIYEEHVGSLPKVSSKYSHKSPYGFFCN